jgi:hypothetical protein
VKLPNAKNSGVDIAKALASRTVWPGRFSAIGERRIRMRPLPSNWELPNADALARCPKLKVVGRGGVGIENIDVKACHARGVGRTAPSRRQPAVNSNCSARSAGVR